MAEIAEAVQKVTPDQPMGPPKIRGPVSKFSKVLDTVSVSSAEAPEGTADQPSDRMRLLPLTWTLLTHFTRPAAV